MPVQFPKKSMGILKNRSRLSASTLTAYERCKNQWFSKYRMGLSSPINPRMILGSLVEETSSAESARFHTRASEIYPSKWFSIEVRPNSAPMSTGVTWSVNCAADFALVVAAHGAKTHVDEAVNEHCVVAGFGSLPPLPAPLAAAAAVGE